MPDPMEIAPPDLGPHAAGNCGIPHMHSFDSGRAGPHVLLLALIHGNELSGAIALDALLRQGLRPHRGRLTVGFANVAAFLRFSPTDPHASRYVDQDMNRLWDPAVLDGPGRSVELDRARALRPLIDRVDVLLDLHSMQYGQEPLLLSGPRAKNRAFARAVGTPPLIVADPGHSAGRRLRDYGRFDDPADPALSLLAECGQHWRAATATVALGCCLRLLDHLAMLPPGHPIAPPTPHPSPRLIEVTDAVTVTSDRFVFAKDFVGMERLPQGALIAHDGDRPVRAPYEDCILIMPCRRLRPGQTAVRLGREQPA